MSRDLDLKISVRKPLSMMSFVELHIKDIELEITQKQNERIKQLHDEFIANQKHNQAEILRKKFKSLFKTDTYDFNKNLIELSISSDINECLKEWIIVGKGTTDSYNDEENRCVCNRLIKQYYILRNNFNYNHIKMGFGCIKKLNDENTNKIDTRSKSIKNNLIKLFEKGYYIEIEDLDKYAEDILIEYISSKDDIITYIHHIIDNYKNNIYLYKKIEKILIDHLWLKQSTIKFIENIIDIYKDKPHLYSKIEYILSRKKNYRDTCKIKEIEKQKKIAEELDRQNKETEELDRQNKEKEELDRQNKEREEKKNSRRY
jgi:hypothetical protein